MPNEIDVSREIAHFLKENQALLVHSTQAAANVNTDIKIRVASRLLLGKTEEEITTFLNASFKPETSRVYLEGGKAIISILESMDCPFVNKMKNITPKRSRINEKKLLALSDSKSFAKPSNKETGELATDEIGNHISEPQ